MVAETERRDPVISMEQVAHWACDLNTWKWPDDWGPAPEWIQQKFAKGEISTREMYEHEKARYQSIMNGLISLCGEREYYRVHNVVRRKAMTEDQFEIWWNENFGTGGGE